MNEMPQASKKIKTIYKFNERFSRLQKLDKFTDCSFKIENKILNCHKLILAASSPVFEAMLYNFDGESTKSILIADINFNSFKMFIDFLYTGKLYDNENLDYLIDIASCAQKYMIDYELKIICNTRMSEMLNPENVFKIFAKSFKYRVEDFKTTCLYFFVNALESGSSLCNVMSDEEILLPECFEFLVKNLLDYFDDKEPVLMLIKAWLIHPFNTQSNSNVLNLDSQLSEKVNSMKNAFLNLISRSRYFHRIYYKSVRPLIIDKSQNSIDISVSFSKFVAIKFLMLNSRLIPEQYDICEALNQPYKEEIEVEIFLQSSKNEILYTNRLIVENVFFNCSFKLSLCDNMILFPHLKYVIKLKWNEEKSLGFEYPKAIYSMVEKEKSIVQFYEHTSIVQGIHYEIVN